MEILFDKGGCLSESGTVKEVGLFVFALLASAVNCDLEVCVLGSVLAGFDFDVSCKSSLN